MPANFCVQASFKDCKSTIPVNTGGWSHFQHRSAKEFEYYSSTSRKYKFCGIYSRNLNTFYYSYCKIQGGKVVVTHLLMRYQKLCHENIAFTRPIGRRKKVYCYIIPRSHQDQHHKAWPRKYVCSRTILLF